MTRTQTNAVVTSLVILPGKWGWSVVRSLSEQLDQLLHDPQNRHLAAGLLPESSDLDKE